MPTYLARHSRIRKTSKKRKKGQEMARSEYKFDSGNTVGIKDFDTIRRDGDVFQIVLEKGDEFAFQWFKNVGHQTTYLKREESKVTQTGEGTSIVLFTRLYSGNPTYPGRIRLEIWGDESNYTFDNPPEERVQ
jgi:hypothetical protein